MKLQQFSGGLATRLAPQLLGQDQGVVYENIDNAAGILKPVKTKLATAIQVEKYNVFFTTDQEWVSSATPTSFLEFQRVLYATDGDIATKYSNGITNNLGITLPSLAPTVVSQNTSTPLDAFVVQNDLSQGDLTRSELVYRMYNAKGDVLSAPVEFTLSKVSEVSAGTTDLITAELVEQVVEEEVTTQVVYGSNRYAPTTVRTITTTVVTDLRAVTINDIVNNKEDGATGARLYRYYGQKWYLLHTFDTTDTFTDLVYDISGKPELDVDLVSVFNGTYQYVYTYYNSTDGTESAPSPISPELDLMSGEVALTLAASSDPQVTHTRIYRVGGQRTLFAMVAELPISTLSYADHLLDSDMDGRLLESEDYYAAPAGLQFLSESYAMLFGAVDSTLYFTPIGVPNAWPPEFSIQVNAPITGIGPVANGVLVFTRTQTFLVTGTGPTSLAIQPLRGDQGCVSHFSIQEVQKGALVWASADGLCSSSGNDVVNITKAALGDIKLVPVNSAVVDEVYYLQLEDGTTLAWDYRFAPIFKTFSLALETVTAAESEIYGWADGVMYLLFKGEDTTTFSYTSPRFVEGSLTESKTYKKVYIHHDGDIIINILIDDELVTTKALSGKDSTTVQVPSDKQRGFYIQFEISGTGLVNEIEYTAGRQKDG